MRGTTADGQYRRGSPVNIGNNFWTFEPNAAVTYESQDFVLTLHAIYDINMANTDSPYSRNGRYASCNEVVADYTGAVKLGAPGVWG